jgi:hypothetical protein
MANSIHGKTELSLRRKKSNTPASQTPTISSDLKFAHQLNAGETTIPLDALVLPTQMPAFVNPSATEIANANVKANASNLILVSSLKGTLMCDLSYKVISNTQINLEFEAEANEIIIGHFRATRGTDQLLEGRLWSVSGTLTAGDTDFALGQSFKTNANSNYQIGEVIVFVDGVQQYRNVDNATAAPAADGNYEEVDAGGVFNLIRFNDVYPVDVAVTVVPSSYIVTTSDLALQPQLDALAGQVDQMIPTLAAIAGVPETEFQGQPNNVDLKSFGDKVQQNRSDIDSNDVDILALQNKVDTGAQTVSEFTKTKWQRKQITGVTGTGNLIQFNNLDTSGNKTYRFKVFGRVEDNSSDPVFQCHLSYNGANLNFTDLEIRTHTASHRIPFSLEEIFTPVGGNGIAALNITSNAADDVWAVAFLEELPNHEETSDFT